MNQGIKQKQKNSGLYGIRTLDLCTSLKFIFSGFPFARAKSCFLTVMIFFHLILYPAVLIYDFHIFTTLLSSFHGFRIPYKPEFFFRLSFRNCKSCIYNCDDLLSYKVSYSSPPCSSYHLRREFSRISHFYNFFYN